MPLTLIHIKLLIKSILLSQAFKSFESSTGFERQMSPINAETHSIMLNDDLH